MAQYIFSDMVAKAGLSRHFEIDSAATSSEEIGNPVYPPAYRELTKHGIAGIAHRARRFTSEDYRHFDHIFVMDGMNMRNMMRMTDGDPAGKVEMLLDEVIDDPWYTDNFELAYAQIHRGCKALLTRFSTNIATGIV